ncbi:MAG: hypothetical protein WCI89_00380 [bacterium]
MKNFKKGFLLPIVLAVVAFLVVGGGMYFYIQKNKTPSVATNKTVTTTQITNTIQMPAPSEVVQTTDTNRMRGPGTYEDSKYGFSFAYSNWWVRDSNHPSEIISLYHQESPQPQNDSFGKGNSKIEIVIRDRTSMLQDLDGYTFSTTTIKGQLAYTSPGGEGVGAMYFIEIPRYPGVYLRMVMYGYGTKSQLNEVVNTLIWR